MTTNLKMMISWVVLVYTLSVWSVTMAAHPDSHRGHPDTPNGPPDPGVTQTLPGVTLEPLQLKYCQDEKDFRCVTGMHRGYCVSSYGVCDKQNDCSDGSDEWPELCGGICWIPGGRKGFSCDSHSTQYKRSNGTDEKNGTATMKPEFQMRATFHNLCLSFDKFCNCEQDCGNSGMDEKNCGSLDCRSHSGYGKDWLTRILVASLGLIILFGLGAVLSIAWERKKRAMQISIRAERRQRLIDHVPMRHDRSERRRASGGEVNMGAVMDPVEMNTRMDFRGGEAVAPPPYSIAVNVDLPKLPDNPSGYEDPPPAYTEISHPTTN